MTILDTIAFFRNKNDFDAFCKILEIESDVPSEVIAYSDKPIGHITINDKIYFFTEEEVGDTVKIIINEIEYHYLAEISLFIEFIEYEGRTTFKKMSDTNLAVEFLSYMIYDA